MKLLPRPWGGGSDQHQAGRASGSVAHGAACHHGMRKQHASWRCVDLPRRVGQQCCLNVIMIRGVGVIGSCWCRRVALDGLVGMMAPVCRPSAGSVRCRLDCGGGAQGQRHDQTDAKRPDPKPYARRSLRHPNLPGVCPYSLLASSPAQGLAFPYVTERPSCKPPRRLFAKVRLCRGKAGRALTQHLSC